MRLTWICALIIAALTVTQADAAITLVKNGKTDHRIIVATDASPAEKRAAAEFKNTIAEMSGVQLAIEDDTTPAPAKAVLIGDSAALRSMKLSIPNMGPEEYVIRTVGNRLIIAGGRPRGTLYGVYAFLEEQLGCRWYSSKVSAIPKKSVISIGKLDITGKPAFEYRDVFITDAFDKDWAARNRTNGFRANLDEETGGKVTYHPFVHTFAYLVPLEKYWDTHPEYYSMIDGKRVKDQTQLCLTNPEVLKIATAQVLVWMKEHPEAKIYSVSQNDWYNNCQCDKCKAIDEEEGSPSGLMLRFVNSIAEVTEKVYPDKLVDTLAYQYTEKPPKITKPRANVRVRLCPIFCCEAHPYEKCNDKVNIEFVQNLRNWAKITDNLYIWHYNTNFSHYMSPFPSFIQVADSARLYKKTGVKGIFWQGNYTSAVGEFTALRAYLLAKISWNPNVDANAVMTDFLNGYYGPSARYIREYIQLLEDKVTKENIHFKIFDAPDSAAYLTPEIIAKSDELLSKAESAAPNDEMRDRVRLVRLSMDYVKLTQPVFSRKTKGREAELLAKLEEFANECKRLGVTNVSEGTSLEAFWKEIKRVLEGK